LNNQDKTKEELVKELQKLKQTHDALKVSFKESIKKRKLTEEALAKKIKYFDALVANIPIGVYILGMKADGHLKYEYVSDRWCEIHKISREDALSDATLVNGLIHKDDLEDFFLHNRKAVCDLKPFAWEGRVIIEGKLHWFSIESVPEVIKNGDIRWYGVSQDITKSKHQKEASTKLKDIMAQAEELAKLGSWEWDIQNDNWILSENWKRIHGVDDAKLTTHELLLIAHPEDRPLIEEAFAKAAKSGEPYEIEHRIIRKDTGEVRYVSAKGLVLFDSEGKPNFMVGTSQDINERKQAEIALRESEEKFRSLADTAKVVIDIVADDKGKKRLYVNNEWTRVHGYSKEEAQALKPIDLVAPDCRQQVLENAEKRMQGKQVSSNYEIKTISKSGEIKHLDFSSTVMNFDNQKAFLTTAIDITEQKKVEEALRKSEDKLLQLNAQKDKFFSIIGHELRNPFTAIIGFSDLLAEQIKEKDYEGIDKYAKFIGQSSKQALNLLMNLLEWSRAQTGRIEFNPEKLNLEDVIEENKMHFSIIAKQKVITIKKVISNDLTVFADRPMLSTVLRNLISNAIKFTGEKGKIKISAEKSGKKVTVNVSDNGIGIEPEKLKKLFQLDVSNSTPGTNNEKGTGLGLILCKEFVEKHGGKIWVQSKPGKGTTFYFTLFCNDNHKNSGMY